tara:strand:+ start:92 stop:289 length:198 start_codon:yes stop_codon:yes gene_type:complete
MTKKSIQKAKSRARTIVGHFKADDPTTPEVNEAFVVPDPIVINVDDNRIAQRSVGGRYLGGKLVE